MFSNNKKENESMKEKIISDIKNIFKLENEDYYKPIRLDSFIVAIILNMKVMVTGLKIFQLKNILINLSRSYKI